VLVDRHGNVIDGQHRLTADKNWPKIKLESVETEEQRLLARLISNVCRRHVPAEEKTEMLGRLGEIYLKEGVEPGKIAEKIMEKTGMSYRWVMKYLPDKFKERAGLGGPSKALKLDKNQEKSQKSKVARRATGEEELLLTVPPEKKVVTVKNYANTHFVNVIVEKPFYTRLEKVAEKLGTSPEVLISNALLLVLKKLEERLDVRALLWKTFQGKPKDPGSTQLTYKPQKKTRKPAHANKPYSLGGFKLIEPKQQINF